ncbi:MAG: glutamate racemase [Alphaproteobacteria bacterium]|nr:glutamate racemase [Alphaproteobacteria bacterium]MCD8526234.1 glutamate racemase [Alphaproteobacteria bacterium]MCD8570749.1 glutamate racemase [Alphaproteobacteria bacterium]
MKIGVFDSGLGGLLICKAIRDRLPEPDIIYLGDTLHLPYGNRSQEAIYTYTRRAMEFLFQQGCKLIIVACNTASAAALRQLQQQWLPQAYSDRRILGVVVPTLEAAIDSGSHSIGVLATNYITRANIYGDELQKLNPAIALHPIAAPLLVPLIENDGLEWVEPALQRYFAPVQDKGLDSLILGCTHYPLIRPQVEKILPGVKILSQDEIIPPKLDDYLQRHPEISDEIARNGSTHFYVSDITDSYHKAAERLYGYALNLEKADLGAGAL